MKRLLLSATAIAAALGFGPAFASSHREAPAITQTPKLDGTDFYMFRSYQGGRSGYVTLIADYQPFETEYGGPNFYTMDPNAVYDINIDNSGSGRADMRFRFRFTNTNQNLSLNIGGTNVAVPLVNIGPISSTSTANQNVIETYTLSLVTPSMGGEVETPITGTSGNTVFMKPIDDIGEKSIPDYAMYSRSFVQDITIPGCAKPGRVFVGQRKDPFFVNLGQTFDLINYAHPVGEQYANTVPNSLDQDNVTALELEVPTACLTKGSDPVIGGWTTSSTVSTKNGVTTMKQASRLGNPLVNEVLIGLPDKDKWNTSLPQNDAQFMTYFTNPTLPALIDALFGTAPPVTPRPDLVAVFLTGLAGINQPAHLAQPSEEMRLNTSVPPTPLAQQNRLGVIGNPALNQPGDPAGYPNGRRPGDDVVDISLRVAMGRLYTLGVFSPASNAPSGALDFTDGTYGSAADFGPQFPYLRAGLSSSVVKPAASN